MHRESRTYAYDDQHAVYPISHQAADYSSTGGYQSFDSTGHYYAPPVHGTAPTNDGPTPYARSMTPSLVSANRYHNGTRDPRFMNGQGAGGSSSSLSQSVYPAQNQYYGSQYTPPSDHRPVPLNAPQFIPTPSEIANNYSNYSHPMSPNLQDDYSPNALEYSSPPHMVPSSHGSIHRPRIVTSRPRTGSSTSISPTSAQSPSGERFPCEKCGKTFSRSHDRKRHHETQHLASPVIHRCRYCEKEFSRADSLKRHIDNGCDEMHSHSHS